MAEDVHLSLIIYVPQANTCEVSKQIAFVNYVVPIEIKMASHNSFCCLQIVGMTMIINKKILGLAKKVTFVLKFLQLCLNPILANITVHGGRMY
jgi:hypothetical protein